MSLTNIGLVQHIGSYFVWEIENFCNDHKEVGEFLLSPVFVTTCVQNYAEWRLKLYPNGDDENVKEYLSLYIECWPKEKIIGDVIFSVLNDKNYKRWGWRMSNRIFDNEKHRSWGNPKFVRRHLIFDKNNGVLPEGTLRILCEIILNPKDASFTQLSTNHVYEELIGYRLEQLDDFEKLLESGNCSDITFSIGTFEIKAHKAVIISRSPVFQAMFEHDMKEKENNVIQIFDIKYHIVKELLRFMYASKVNNIQSNAAELLVAAEKYAIKGLKVLCEKELARNIKFKNVFKRLQLAEMCNASILKSQAIDFILRYKHDIIERPEFKEFAALHSNTICEVFRAIVKN